MSDTIKTNISKPGLPDHPSEDFILGYQKGYEDAMKRACELIDAETDAIKQVQTKKEP